VNEKNASFALDRVGLVITQMGGTGAVGRVKDKPVLFDDLHGRNIKVAPNGRVEVVDAINRELTREEVEKFKNGAGFQESLLGIKEEIFQEAVRGLLSGKISVTAQPVKEIVHS
jgi:hypothetical protein